MNMEMPEGNLLKEETLCVDDGIYGACIMAGDADCLVDPREILRGVITFPVQTHSINIGEVTHAGQTFDDTDALLCFTSDVPVGVATADCVPILVYAPDIRGIAAIHAGWRGTLDGIVENVLDALEKRGVDLSLTKVYFGPSISVGRYEVDCDLAEKFRSAGFSDCVTTPVEGGRPHIDLQGVNMCHFLNRGVKEGNIQLHPGCTYDSRNADGSYIYQSHRRSHGNAGRMLTWIKML